MHTSATPISLRRLVDERICAPAIGKSVGWLRKDRLNSKIVPFVRVGTSIRYDLDRVFAVVMATEEGGQGTRT